MNDIIAHATIIIGVLVALTNIIVEVGKKVIPLKSSEVINRFATIVGIILTVVAGIGYCAYANIPLDVLKVIALIIAGIMVAYGSMFGFDKLLSYFEKKDGE